LTKRKK